MVLAYIPNGRILYRRTNLRVCPFSSRGRNVGIDCLRLSFLLNNWFPRIARNRWLDRIFDCDGARFKSASLYP